MKTLFRKLAVMAFCLTTTVLNASADNKKPVTFEQMPAPAQQFVKTHFASSKVLATTFERELLEKSYDVVLNDGTKLEFDSKGEWTDVACPKSGVPSKVLPEGIKTYLNSNFPNVKVKKIERDSREYEVTLENGTEITCNKTFQVKDIDL